MKTTLRAIFFLSAILAAVLVTVPQSRAADTPAAGGARISIPDATYDFGAVRQGTRVEHQFELKNTGTSPLKIERLHTSCGCTAAVLDSDTIAPGGKTSLKATFDTSGFQGAKMKVIRLYTNDPKQPSALLTLQGKVQPDVELSAARLQFGDVRREDAPVLKLTVSARKDLGIAIEAPATRSPYLELVTEDFSQGDQAGKQITVKLKDNVPRGTFRDRIIVRTSSGNNPVVNVPVIARVQGDVRLAPSTLSFGLVEDRSGPNMSRTVKLERTGRAPVKIVSVESDSPSVTGEAVTLKDDTTQGVKVTINSDVVGAFRARVKITTDNADPEQRQLVLPVYGIVSGNKPS